jgi:hypothetical protein
VLGLLFSPLSILNFLVGVDLSNAILDCSAEVDLFVADAGLLFSVRKKKLRIMFLRLLLL